MVPEYCRCLINLGFLPLCSPHPSPQKVTASPHIRPVKALGFVLWALQANWGRAEAEKVKKDGLSHKGMCTQDPEIRVQCVISCLLVQIQIQPPDWVSFRWRRMFPCPAGVTLNESCGPHFWKSSHFKARTKLCFTWAWHLKSRWRKRIQK